MIAIVKVKCPRCGREFKTVPAVLEHVGSPTCPVCGVSMVVSQPQPLKSSGKGKTLGAA